MWGLFAVNKKVRTVLGDIDPQEIENTLIHEHLVMDLTQNRHDTTSILGTEETLAVQLAELNELKNLGFNTIVELTNIGMGRNPLKLKQIAETTGFNIVVGTGFYKEDMYPEMAFSLSEGEISELLANEVEAGIEGTGIKAGLFGEIGSSHNRITPVEEKIFRAAAKSQKRTGAAISTHCELGTMGFAQMKILDREGVNPARVSFGHQDLNLNQKEQRELLRWGAFIQFDTIGKTRYQSDEARLKNLLELLDAGFEDQIMVSGDISRKTYLKEFGGYGYTHVYSWFIEKLQSHGVNQTVIRKLLIENPRRFLSF